MKKKVESTEPVRIHWATPPHDGVGNALGYQTHIRYLKKYAEAGGHTIDDPESEIALSIISADQFKPVPGKFNVLFTMWEAIDLPQTYIDGINKADLIITPCQWCKELFKRHTHKPVEVCWHGTDVEAFKFHDRTKQRVNYYHKPFPWSKPEHSRRFRFLWVGAPNPRKGYQEILSVLGLAEQNPGIEIYMKTTCVKVKWTAALKSLCKNFKHIFYFKHGNWKVYWQKVFLSLLRIPRPTLANRLKIMGINRNVIFDTRMLSRAELIDLYNSANCFLFPTWGEGWGLTLSEAMSTGCPSIATRVTGVEEFFDNAVGYEIKHEVKETDLRDYNMSARTYRPVIMDMAAKMVHVLRNYPEALKKGKLASERMRTKFTWEKSGARLGQIIRSHKKCQTT